MSYTFNRIKNKINNLFCGSARGEECVAEQTQATADLGAQVPEQQATAETPQEYWNRVNVVAHRVFNTYEESITDFWWRCYLYNPYLQLMPLDQADGRVVLDYGCGPGYDVVGFMECSKPARLIGVDVSRTSLDEADIRAQLHGSHYELVQIDEHDERLPFEDQTFDIIHSSGVLHHTPDPVRILKELHRVLKDDGYAQIMVYNYESIWVHLWTAFEIMVCQKKYTDLGLRGAFSKVTDGPECPISMCYTPLEFIDLAAQGGFKAEYKGAAISTSEMRLLPTRFDALGSHELNDDSRRFLYDLTFNDKGQPLYNGHVAGVDGCFHLKKS